MAAEGRVVPRREIGVDELRREGHRRGQFPDLLELHAPGVCTRSSKRSIQLGELAACAVIGVVVALDLAGTVPIGVSSSS